MGQARGVCQPFSLPAAAPRGERRDLPFQLEMVRGGGAGSPAALFPPLVCVKCSGWHCKGDATRNLAFSPPRCVLEGGRVR